MGESITAHFPTLRTNSIVRGNGSLNRATDFLNLLRQRRGGKPDDLEVVTYSGRIIDDDHESVILSRPRGKTTRYTPRPKILRLF